MKKWKLVLGILLILLLGVLAGSLGTNLYHKYRHEGFRQDPSARNAFFLEMISRELDLTESQKRAFREIIDKLGNRIEEHFRKSHLEARKIMDEGFDLMSRDLTPDQRKKLLEMKKNFDRRGPGRGGPPGPPPFHPPPPPRP